MSLLENFGDLLGNVLGDFESASIKFQNGGASIDAEEGLNINIRPNSERLRVGTKEVQAELIDIERYEEIETNSNAREVDLSKTKIDLR